MKNVIVIGAGGHARVVIDALRKEAKHNLVGVIDNTLPPGTPFAQTTILGGDDCIKHLENIDGVVIAIGDNWKRAAIAKKITEEAPHLHFVTVIHPHTSIAQDVIIGQGSMVLAGAIINPGTVIGKHCIINTKASVDHDNLIEDFVSIAPGATLGGRVRIGQGSVVALGANIIHNKTIGNHSIVGAGALVLEDIDSQVVVVGIPAKKLRDHVPGTPYL